MLTGFLGAGKTSLLNRLLRDPALADTAVIINEFGEIGLDHLLVKTIDDNMVLLQSGCLCCTLRGDLVDALEKLLRDLDNGRVGVPPRDPGDHRARRSGAGAADRDGASLSGDALPARRRRSRWSMRSMAARRSMTHMESVKQVAVADRIVLTKTDLLDAPERRRDQGAICSRACTRSTRPRRILDAAAGEATPARLSTAACSIRRARSPT